MMVATTILWRAIGAAFVAIVLYVFGIYAGPDVEAAVAPVLTRQTIGDVERVQPGLACWTWTWAKTREAAGVDAGWTIRAGGRVWPYQRVFTIADSEGIADALPKRPVGPGRFSRKCIDVPPDLWSHPFRITGFVEYRSAATGWAWTVRQPTHDVVVP